MPQLTLDDQWAAHRRALQSRSTEPPLMPPGPLLDKWVANQRARSTNPALFEQFVANQEALQWGLEEELTSENKKIIESNVGALKLDASGDLDSDYFVPPQQPRAAVVKILPSHVAHLKNITSTLLPIHYPDKFYNECLNDSVISAISRVLLFDSKPVGWIRCRLEMDDKGLCQIYIVILGILAPYRGYGLATCLLDRVVHANVVQSLSASSIWCHVWESNQDGLEWYKKRGFKRGLLQGNYYRRLKPSGAWIMRMNLDMSEPSDQTMTLIDHKN